MLKKTTIIVATISLSICLLLSGCGDNADLTLKLSPDSVTTYKYSQENIKSVKFDRSTMKDSDAKVTKSSFEIVYDQKVASVEADGSVIADISIKEFKYNSTSPKGNSTNLDTTDPNQNDHVIAKLIGKTYKIKLDKSSQAQVVEQIVNDLAGKEAQIVKAVFSDKNIAKMHSIAPLKDADSISSMKAGTVWKIEEASPKDMMQGKSYEKIYELKSLDKKTNVANIEMTTIPGQTGASAGMFAMFGDKIEADFQDSYSGQLKIDTATGQIVNFSEELNAEWVAVDRSKEEENEEPDVLTIGFVKKFTLESI